MIRTKRTLAALALAGFVIVSAGSTASAATKSDGFRLGSASDGFRLSASVDGPRMK